MAASARNAVAFDGIDYNAKTYKYGNTLVYDVTTADGIPAATPGRAVTISASQTVQLAADGEMVIGRLLALEDDGYCAVQDDGVALLAGGNAATLTPGTKICGALDASSNKGFIRTVGTGTVAAETVGRGRILDATDAANVAVDFG